MREGSETFEQPGYARSPHEWERVPFEYDRQRLWNYRYINSVLIDSYLAQLGGVPQTKKAKTEFGLRNGLPNVSFEREASGQAPTYEQKIPILLDRLERADLITGARPLRSPDVSPDAPPLALETFVAKQVVFPASFFEGVYGVAQLKVWLGYPNPELFVDEPFNWSGSYLFLTEIQFDNREFRLAMSGCSALRFISNVLQNNPPLCVGTKEMLGRFDKRSMADKLYEMSASILEERTITALYRIRYVTNEQYDPAAPQDGRVHDIIGYPLFIAE